MEMVTKGLDAARETAVATIEAARRERRRELVEALNAVLTEAQSANAALLEHDAETGILTGRMPWPVAFPPLIESPRQDSLLAAWRRSVREMGLLD